MREPTWLFNWELGVWDMCLFGFQMWLQMWPQDQGCSMTTVIQETVVGFKDTIIQITRYGTWLWKWTLWNGLDWIAYASLRHSSFSISAAQSWNQISDEVFSAYGTKEASTCLLKLWSWGSLGVHCHQVNHGSDADYQSSDTLWGLHIRTGFCLDTVMAASRDNS